MILAKKQSTYKLYMEWGIKLKSNRKSNKLLKKTFLKFLLNLIIWSVVSLLIFFITMTIFAKLDFQWLYDFSPNIYYTLQELFDYRILYEILIILIWVIGVCILLYKTLKNIFSYMDLIAKASSDLLNKDIEYIELPEELENIEKQLNNLKHKANTNERIARESEKKKDDLIAYLAHDLKTPLTSTIGYLSILDEMDDMPKEQQKKYIGIALDKSYRLEELINELFDIARFNSEKIILQKEELNLNLMLEQIADDFYPILKELNKEIKINTKDNMKLYADPDKLSRVFGNLVKNAINYSSEGSTIIIDVEKKDSSIVVEVKNKGKQIPREKLNRIFEKFYRADSSRTSKTGGSGLGLAIAKDIVELHNGTITAESNELETIFRVELPIK